MRVYQFHHLGKRIAALQLDETHIMKMRGFIVNGCQQIFCYGRNWTPVYLDEAVEASIFMISAFSGELLRAKPPELLYHCQD